MKQVFTYVNSKKWLILLTIILLLWGGVCLYISSSLAKTSAFSENDLLFEIDVPRVIGDMTDALGWHARTNVHPLYVLLVNPLGVMLKILFKSSTSASILLNCSFGLIGIILAFTLFWFLCKDFVTSSLLAGIFALSSSQWILSIVPETASLAVCSLITTYLLFLIALKDRRSHLFLWIVAGIFSLAITSTNFVQTLICFTVHRITILKPYKTTRLVFKVLCFVGILLLVNCAFALLQKKIYHSSVLFFLPKAYETELRFKSGMVLRQPFTVIIQLVKHFFIVNVVAPSPYIYTLPHAVNHLITFSKSWKFNPIGWMALVLWCNLLCTGIVKTFSQKKIAPFFIGIGLCLLFNLAFHCFYGVLATGRIELFLYTGNFTLLVLLLLIPVAMLNKKIVKIKIIFFLLLIGINNYLVIKQIINVYQIINNYG